MLQKGTVNIVYGGSLSEGVLEPVIPRQSIDDQGKLPNWARSRWPFMAEEEYRQMQGAWHYNMSLCNYRKFCDDYC